MWNMSKTIVVDCRISDNTINRLTGWLFCKAKHTKRWSRKKKCVTHRIKGCSENACSVAPGSGFLPIISPTAIFIFHPSYHQKKLKRHQNVSSKSHLNRIQSQIAIMICGAIFISISPKHGILIGIVDIWCAENWDPNVSIPPSPPSISVSPWVQHTQTPETCEPLAFLLHHLHLKAFHYNDTQWIQRVQSLFSRPIPQDFKLAKALRYLPTAQTPSVSALVNQSLPPGHAVLQ